MTKSAYHETNIDLKTGIRYSTAYVNSQNISNELVDDIISQGRDLGYELWKYAAIDELRRCLETLNENHSDDNEVLSDLAAQSGLFPSISKEMSADILEACEFDSDTDFSQVSSEVIEQIMEDSGLMQRCNDSYEAGSNTWLLKEQDLDVQYNNDSNDITIFRSRYVTFLQLASPCFPNGCFMESGDVLAYALEFDCFDDYSVKTIEDLPYFWIYDLQQKCFLAAVMGEDGHVEQVKTEWSTLSDKIDLDEQVLQDLGVAAQKYHAAYLNVNVESISIAQELNEVNNAATNI